MERIQGRLQDGTASNETSAGVKGRRTTLHRRLESRLFSCATKVAPKALCSTRRPCSAVSTNDYNYKAQIHRICNPSCLCSRRPFGAPFPRSALVRRTSNQSVSYWNSFYFLWLIDGPYTAIRPDPASSEPIGGAGDISMSAIETSLAVLKEASALAATIPYISPVAGLLLQALTMRDASVRPLSE